MRGWVQAAVGAVVRWFQMRRVGGEVWSKEGAVTGVCCHSAARILEMVSQLETGQPAAVVVSLRERGWVP